MPSQKRYKTKYAGVYYIKGKAVGSNKVEKIYYIMYRKDGKQVHEKAGRQFQDDMTPSRAAGLRSERIEGKQLSNKEKREIEKAEKSANANRWTVDRLWETYKTNKPNLKGMHTYKSAYKLHIKPSFAIKEPKDILPLDVHRIKNNLLKIRSPQTVQHVLELLRRIINFGVNNKLCQGIDFKIEMPRVDNQKTEDLTPEQLKKLLDAIEADPHLHAGAMMKLALFTGMRRGEMFKLKWKDVDFERGFIKLKDVKGGPDQIIPMNDGAKTVLNGIVRTRSLHVFPGRNGGQRTNIRHQVNRIKMKAGLPRDFRPLHGLRHVYASMLASSGEVDVYTLQKLLTHKDPKMTQRYAHLRDHALKRASNLAGEIVTGLTANKDEPSKHETNRKAE